MGRTDAVDANTIDATTVASAAAPAAEY